MSDVANRLANRVQMITEGHHAYLEAVEGAFGADLDYVQLVKMYGGVKAKTPERKCSPSECTGIKERAVEGEPDIKHAPTIYVEQQNLTTRTHVRRFTRLTNCFSKKFENHLHMVALYAVFYNFIRMHKILKMSSAMAAGVTDKLWNMEDVVALMDAAAPKPGRRGPYKKRGG